MRKKCFGKSKGEIVLLSLTIKFGYLHCIFLTDWFRLSHTRFFCSLALLVYQRYFFSFFGFIYMIFIVVEVLLHV